MSRWKGLVRPGALAALSGGATMAAEVLGARALRPLLGSTAFATAGTVAGVLGGLGLGAWLTARALRRRSFAARTILVATHLALAALTAVAVPLALAMATPVARVLVSLDRGHPWGAELLRTALGLLLTAGPGALAGSLYPAAVVSSGRDAGTATGWIGATSSLGAAALTLASTFVLAPALGVSHTMLAVSCVYLAAAALARTMPATSPAESPVTPRVATPAVDGVLTALVLVGAASTLWQSALTRLGTLSFGPSAFALSSALSAHVLSLSVGELVASSRLARAGVATDRAFARTLALGAVAGIASAPLALALPSLATLRYASGAPETASLWSAALGLVFLAALPLVGCVGAAMAYGALAARRDDAGEANAAVLAATSAGNVLGAVIGPLWLLPRLRIEGMLLLASGLLCLAALRVTSSRVRWAVPAVALWALGAVGVWRHAQSHVDAMLRGPFLYGRGDGIELGRLRWRRDGREATVSVRDDDTGAVLLQINGKVDATSVGDATTQTVVGILPTAMARTPRDVLVVGLGSGMTADAARSVPGVRRVVVAELVPEVIDAARRDFARANHQLFRDPRVEVRAADAAHLLRGSDERFDVIVSEPSNPWVVGMSDLFTVETFRAARERLREGGTFGAWFHAYSTDGDTVASIVHTFETVFPKCVLVEVTPGQDYLLVGAREPWDLDLDRLFARLQDPTVHDRLRAADLPDRASIMARFLGGARGVAAVGAGAALLTAGDLRLEFRAPGLLYHDATPEVFAALARVTDLPLAGLVADTSADSTWVHALDESEPEREASAHLRAMLLADHAGDVQRAVAEGELAVGLEPDDVALRTRLARLYIRRALWHRLQRDPGAAEADLTNVIELRPHVSERFQSLVMLGDLAARRHDGQRALARYDEALAIARAAGQPASELHVRRAEAFAILRAPDAAAEELGVAIRLTDDPARRAALEALRAGRRGP